MVWWVLVLAVLTILSYLADSGVWTLLQDIRIPLLNASLLSVLLLLCTLGVRMLHKKNKGEKEKLRELVDRLEQRPGA
jgi:cobalamin biosynthesis protein CobD/CbiB